MPKESGRPSCDLLGLSALGQDELLPRLPEPVPGLLRFVPFSGKQAALAGHFCRAFFSSTSTSVQKVIIRVAVQASIFLGLLRASDRLRFVFYYL